MTISRRNAFAAAHSICASRESGAERACEVVTTVGRTRGALGLMSRDLGSRCDHPADTVRRDAAMTPRERTMFVRELRRVAQTVQLRAIVRKPAARQLLS
jgi:hypothetical protein